MRPHVMWRPSRGRTWRWVAGIDLWAPRPVDYVLAASFFLLLALLYVGGRHFAVQMDRRIFQLEERRASLREGNDVLAARVNALGNRARVAGIARASYGMTTPQAGAYGLIYYVPEGDVRSARISWWPAGRPQSRR